MASAQTLLELQLRFLEQAANDARQRHGELVGKIDDLIEAVRDLGVDDSRDKVLARLDVLVKEIGRAVPELAREAQRAIAALSAGGDLEVEPQRQDGALHGAQTQKIPILAPSSPPPAAVAVSRSDVGDGETALRLAWKHRGKVIAGIGWLLAFVTGGAVVFQRGCPNIHTGNPIDASTPMGVREDAVPVLAGGKEEPKRPSPQPTLPPAPRPQDRRKQRPSPSPRRPDAANDKEVVPKGHVALPFHEIECDGTRGPHQPSRCLVPLDDDLLPEPVDGLAGTDDLRPAWRRR